MEQVIELLLKDGGIWGVITAVLGYWGWSRSKMVDEINERRLQDVQTLITTVQETNNSANRVADALNNLRIQMDRGS